MSIIRDVARRISRNTSSVRVPKAPQLSQHLGQLSAVDNNTNTAHFVHNGTGAVIPGVPVMLSYTKDITPSVNDTVVMQMHGTSPTIVGYLVVPTNVVTP